MDYGRIARLSLLMFALAGAAQAADKPTIADAAEQRNRALIRELLATGADVNAAQVDGMTALHWAVYNEDAETEECFVDDDGPPGVARAQTIDPIRPGGRRSLWIRTDSRSYTVGDRIRVCFGLPGPGYMRITDRTSDGRRAVLWEWDDDGRGDCMTARMTDAACVSRDSSHSATHFLQARLQQRRTRAVRGRNPR